MAIQKKCAMIFMSNDEPPKYQKPAMRRMTPVSDRELVLLNFIRNQANQGREVKVELTIGASGLNWRIVK